ncbi:MAG: glycosyltransferase family 4 protein, partial [Anaerolineae bacterium]|nr:glycosyltransferase family 4 protein [Anaerolineae bacterium]
VGEVDIFKPVPPTTMEIAAWRHKMGLPVTAHLVLSARAPRPIYNINIVIEAVAQVLKCFPDTIFLLSSYNTDLSYKSQLDELIKNMDLDSHVRWLPQTQDRSELAALYCMSDVVVSVPSSDGTPISVLEAMACGRPVVCSDLASVRELITNKQDGYLVPVGKSKPLAEAICHLLDQPELAADLGRVARQVVVQKYNYELEMEYLQSLYRGLVPFSA